MSALEQAEFVGVYLGPAFHDAQLTTKIIIWDHNCDRPDFPLTVLADSVARLYVHGSAFHLYAGDVRALSDVHNAYPQKQLYFTEQWTGSNGTFSGDLQWHMKNVMIGSLRNWSTTVLEWNLANDPEFNPHTPGGCTECKGALTINGNIIGQNVSYYIVGHASRFIPAGSIRIASSSNSEVHHVAFIRPDNRWTLLLLNESDEKKAITIVIEKKRHQLQLMPKSVVSVVGPLTFAVPKQRQSS
jgi:glucosylceramidase